MRQLLVAVDATDESLLRTPNVIPGGHDDASLWATVTHIVAADEHWLNRWLGNPHSQLSSAHDFRETMELRRAWRACNRRRAEWLESLDEAALGGTLQFFRADATEDFLPLWQTLLHVANHGTHHRAEAWTVLTSFGLALPHGVDMIDWIRAGCPGA